MKFDAYEFIGLIIPGALPTFAACLLLPDLAAILKTQGIELGEFGVFLMVSYVIGHVVQMFGGWIEKFEGFFGHGMTDRAVDPKRRSIIDYQWNRFVRHLESQGRCCMDQTIVASRPYP